ncbi:hypothetical protein CDD83_4851 [Cordyceps sp. RAO-2017]|nr:hypothetical protein CDD83_4851 [Cordyceps sp. RAO-2017]
MFGPSPGRRFIQQEDWAFDEASLTARALYLDCHVVTLILKDCYICNSLLTCPGLDTMHDEVATSSHQNATEVEGFSSERIRNVLMSVLSSDTSTKGLPTLEIVSEHAKKLLRFFQPTAGLEEIAMGRGSGGGRAGDWFIFCVRADAEVPVAPTT